MQIANRLHNIKEYYFSYKLREVRDMIADGKPVINLGIGSPDLPPPKSVVYAIKNAVDDPSTHAYQPYKGLPELREAMAIFYEKYYKASLNKYDEILPLAGAKEGVLHISMAYLNEGDKALIPNPGYATYSSVTKLVGAKPIYYDLKAATNWLPDFEQLEQQDLSKVKIMWINYPNMPTGASASKAVFEKIIAFGKKHNILIVNDNPYSFILQDKPSSIFSVSGAKEVALELNSLSKSYNMAGWRVGMLLGDKKHIDNILKVKSNMDSGMFYGIQQGAIAALKMNNNWFVDLNNIYKKRRNIVWKIADKLNCTYDKNVGGFFVWAKLPEGKSSEEMTEYLLHNKNIFVAPGSIFGTNGEGYIRFSLCTNIEKLEEVLGRI